LSAPAGSWQNGAMPFPFPALSGRRLWPAAFLLAVLLAPAPAAAVWEFGPVTPDTRFPGGRVPVWELGMVYTDESLYPADFSAPAGCPVVLHVLNLSGHPIRLVFTSPPNRVLVQAGERRRIDLGPFPRGHHLFRLEQPVYGLDPGEMQAPMFMRCQLLIGTWPEGEAVFRAAWLSTPQGFFPNTLVLPAGRTCVLAVAGTRDSAAGLRTAGPVKFEVKPGVLDVVDLDRLKGGEFPAGSQGDRLVVR
jgi:hypothetical protein